MDDVASGITVNGFTIGGVSVGAVIACVWLGFRVYYWSRAQRLTATTNESEAEHERQGRIQRGEATEAWGVADRYRTMWEQQETRIREQESRVNKLVDEIEADRRNCEIELARIRGRQTAIEFLARQKGWKIPEDDDDLPKPPPPGGPTA